MTASAAKASTPSSTPVKRTGQSRLLLWLNKLPNHVLGFNPSVAQAIKVEINDLESTSERLANLLQQDPALALSLYQYTHSKVEAKEGDIQSLVHMIGLMGIRHIEQTLTPTPKPLQLHEGQKELYAASLFAAYLSKQLMPFKHGIIGERFFLPTLFFNAPLWLMWQAAPKIMGVIQQDSAKQHNMTKVCNARLGFHLPKLLKRCEQFLQIPEQTVKALNIDIKKDAVLWAKLLRLPTKKLSLWFEKEKTAKHFFYSTEMGIYLVNHYVLALYFDLSGKHIKRFSQLLCKHLNLTQGELASLVSKTAIDIKLPQLFGEETTPQFRVRGLHRDEDYIETEKTSNTISAAHTDPLELLRHAKTTQDALDLAHKAMVKLGTATQSFVFCRGKNTEDSLKVIHYTGLKDGVESLTLKSTLCGQFFKKLLDKPVALIIKPDKIDSIKKQLPRPLLRFWSPRSFSIMSVHHNDQPLAIIGCNSGGWSDSQHLQFKRVGKTLIKTLKYCK